MRTRFHALFFCLLFAAPTTALAQAFQGRDHAHAMLLLSSSDLNVRLGAKSLDRVGSERQEIFDLLAEVVWTACSGNRQMMPDALSWLAKALGNTKQVRFAALLDYCLAQTSNDNTKKHMKLARDNLEGESQSSFEGGKTNLDAVRAHILKQAAAPGEVMKKIGELSQGQTLEGVYSLLGPPSEVNVVSLPGKRAGHLLVKVRTYYDTLVLKYDGVGTIHFIFEQTPHDWLLDEAKGEGELFWSRKRGRFEGAKEQLTDGDGPQLREVAGRLMSRPSIRKDLLDLAADRLFKSHVEPDEGLADGLAWLCRLLMKSGDGRYRQFLLDVSDTAASEKVRKYARKAADSLPESLKDKYVPVSS